MLWTGKAVAEKGELMKKYSWNSGYKPKVKAEVVGKVMEEIQKEGKQITNVELLEKSRPIESPTHSLFEWDDTVAAERYRLHQSQCIINHLRITVITPEKTEVQIKAFVDVGKKGQNNYVGTITALQDEDMREIVLNNIQRELNSFIKRNSAFEELADLLIDAGTRLKKGKVEIV